MNDTIQRQYSTGLSRNNIERALVSAGKNLDHLEPADLGLLEDFHTMGRYATSQLVDLAQITTQSRCSMPAVGSAAPPATSQTATAARLPPSTSPTNTAKRTVGSIGLSGSMTSISVHQAT